MIVTCNKIADTVYLITFLAVKKIRILAVKKTKHTVGR